MSEKKIPTIVGVLSVLAIIGILTVIRRPTTFFSLAGKKITPQNVAATNITETSFVVSWITEKETTGMVRLLSPVEEKAISDYRDQPGVIGEYDTHYIVVENLEPDTEYKFVIISDNNRFYHQGDNPYSIKTAVMTSGLPPRANLASGRVVTQDDQPAKGAIVKVTIPNISPLSALVTSQGNWVISLTQAYNEDLQQRANYQEGEIVEEIIVLGGQMGEASAKVYSKNDDPVPEIKLGQDYDFTQQDEEMLIEQNTPAPTDTTKFGVEDADVTEKKEFKIINPDDGDRINISRPEIFGEGPAGGKIEIILESPVKHETEIEIGPDGEWQWTPPQDLSPGSHTLTVNYTDPETKTTETFVRTFVLAASSDESGPDFSATPSGETVTPTNTPTSAPTSTPAGTPSPTASPTSTPPPRKTQPSTESGVPDAGFWGPTIILIGSGLIVFLGLIGF